jgi:hypothetical protein
MIYSGTNCNICHTVILSYLFIFAIYLQTYLLPLLAVPVDNTSNPLPP